MPVPVRGTEDGAGKDSHDFCPNDTYRLTNLMGGMHAFHFRKQFISHMVFFIQIVRDRRLASRRKIWFACVLFVQLSAF